MILRLIVAALVLVAAILIIAVFTGYISLVAPKPQLSDKEKLCRKRLDKILKDPYVITDPNTCAFRYISDENCPGQPSPVDVTKYTVSEGESRGKWKGPIAGQNWIGDNRCRQGTIYYGKTSSVVDCENKCKSDPKCYLWSWNKNNMYKGADTVQECHGAESGQQPYVSSWGGFISGGIVS